MSFPNADWQEETKAPRWHPVAGKPSVFTHDDRPDCEVEIVRVECTDCGSHKVVMHAVCACPDHQQTQLSKADRMDAHETCCGHRMLRLAQAQDGSWPLTTAERIARRKAERK